MKNTIVLWFTYHSVFSEMKLWLEQPANFDRMSEVFNSTSRSVSNEMAGYSCINQAWNFQISVNYKVA